MAIAIYRNGSEHVCGLLLFINSEGTILRKMDFDDVYASYAHRVHSDYKPVGEKITGYVRTFVHLHEGEKFVQRILTTGMDDTIKNRFLLPKTDEETLYIVVDAELVGVRERTVKWMKQEKIEYTYKVTIEPSKLVSHVEYHEEYDHFLQSLREHQIVGLDDVEVRKLMSEESIIKFIADQLGYGLKNIIYV